MQHYISFVVACLANAVLRQEKGTGKNKQTVTVKAHWALLAYEHRTRRVRIIDSMPLYLPDRVQELAAHLADLADRWNGFSSGTVTVGNMECVQAQQESECGVMALNGLVYVTSGFFGSLTRKKYALRKQYFKVRAAQALGAPR